MDKLQAIYLAMIQGFTEFLPISSSGHLVLYPLLSGQSVQNVAFDVAVHFGSLLAVIVYFRKDILALSGAWAQSIVQRKNVGESRVAWAVIWATVPVGIAGLSLHFIYDNDIAHARNFSLGVLAILSALLLYFLVTRRRSQLKYTLFAMVVMAALIGLAYFLGNRLRESILIIAITTVVFGLVLLVIDLMRQRARNLSGINWKDVVMIGVAQMVALIPGTSRSGITITAALLMGFNRKDAARFSFLLSIPAILLAAGAEFYKISQSGQAIDLDWVIVSIGVVVSAITAYLCIHLFLKFIERIGMIPFVFYRLVLGGILFYLIYIGTLSSGL